MEPTLVLGLLLLLFRIESVYLGIGQNCYVSGLTKPGVRTLAVPHNRESPFPRHPRSKGDLDKIHWCILNHLTQSSMGARTINLGGLCISLHRVGKRLWLSEVGVSCSIRTTFIWFVIIQNYWQLQSIFTLACHFKYPLFRYWRICQRSWKLTGTPYQKWSRNLSPQIIICSQRWRILFRQIIICSNKL